MHAVKADAVRVGGRSISISHPDRVIFPDDGITKGEVVDYYRRVAPAMLPHLRGRPVMMQRLTGGLGRQAFYQKAIPDHFPDWIRRTTVGKVGGTVTHVICDDAATLVYIANQGCITPHVWLSRADRLNHPDRIIFDLDPSGDDVAEVRRAAGITRDFLTDVGLAPFLMATGSRGFHVVVPIRRTLDFDEVRVVTSELAVHLAERAPELLTTEWSKKRRGGRVYIDILRSTYAQTAVPPYAIRPRPGAPVAVPLEWDELERAKPDGWSLRSVLDRLGEVPDPWKGMARSARSLGVAQRWLAREVGDSA